MKQVFVTFSLMVFSAISFAAPQHVVLCERQLILAEEEVKSPDLIRLQEDNIDDLQSVNPIVLKVINSHIRRLEYTDKDLTLEEVKVLFSEGDYRYDDLYISSHKSKSTGFIYYEVVSYPGDNQYGMFTDLSGNTVALVNDGDIYLNENGGDIACYDFLGL